MKANESGIDRIVRVVVGVALLAVGLFVLHGTIAVVLDVLGAVLLVTGVLGFCPLYAILGVKTLKKS